MWQSMQNISWIFFFSLILPTFSATACMIFITESPKALKQVWFVTWQASTEAENIVFVYKPRSTYSASRPAAKQGQNTVFPEKEKKINKLTLTPNSDLKAWWKHDWPWQMRMEPIHDSLSDNNNQPTLVWSSKLHAIGQRLKWKYLVH